MPPSAKSSAVRDTSTEASLTQGIPSAKPSNSNPAQATELPSFESALGRLSEIVDRLESAELPLEESLRLFEEGVSLSRVAQARLNAAEKRVEELLSVNDDGVPVVRELGVDER